MRYLSLSCEDPFQNDHGKDTSMPQLKSGAIWLRQLATPLPRRDFRPTFFALFVPFCGHSRFFAIFAFFRSYPCLCLIFAPLG
jgi:hypothetical protein